MKVLVITCLLLLSLPLTIFALDLTKQNFNYLYDPYAAIEIKHKLSAKEDVFTLYFRLKLRSALRPENKFELNIFKQTGYSSKSSLALEPVLLAKDSSATQILFKYEFKLSEKYDLIVGQFLINNVYYYYDIPINQGLFFKSTDLLPLNKRGWPYFDEYANVGTETHFDTLAHAFRYPDQFKVSRPPMSKDSPSGQSILEIDSTFVVQQFKLTDENALYFFQGDSSGSSGISLLTVSPYYPKIRRINKLTGPVIYLATKSEYETMQDAENKKEAFDRFWISMLNSSDLAKKILKRFYNNVKMSNTFFTSYKEGWKTDRGMIYIIFGSPQRVSRTEEKEIWTYTIGGKKQNFTFQKYPNLFVQYHYVLDRQSNLSNIWNNEVGKWRRGNI